MKEKLSALLDGELDTGELDRTIENAAKEPQLRRAWSRYHLIGDLMRQQLDQPAPAGLVNAVASRIQSEPSILAPRRRFAKPRRMLAGMAVAASVAAVALVGVRVVAPTQIAAPQLAAKSVESADYLRSDGTHWQAIPNDVEDDLNMYLVQHSEFAPATGMNGVMSYVRFVGYDSEK